MRYIHTVCMQTPPVYEHVFKKKEKTAVLNYANKKKMVLDDNQFL